MKKSMVTAALAAAIAGGSSGAFADNTAAALEQYRQMIQDSNPAELFEMEGEELWTTARGPKNATLEQCDLGLGSGVVEGAYAQMPRYFQDTGRVQDLESRLMTCIENLQGIPSSEIINGKFRQGERGKVASLVAYVVGMSRGDTIKVDLDHPKNVCHGRKGLLVSRGADGLRVRHLPFDGRRAYPHAGSAESDHPEGRRGRLGLLACVSRVELAVLDHAASSQRLLPPAAHG
jgi:hypothetical protein